MDEILKLLSGSLGVLLGVLVGAALTFAGTWMTSRATERASRRATDASVAVAADQRAAERRVRMDELTYEDRRALVDELLRLLGEQELETMNLWESTWDYDSPVMRHRPKGFAIVSRMRAVFPNAVTEAASSAVSASVAAAQAHMNVDRHVDADRTVKANAERHRIDELLRYEKARDAFLAEVQAVMTRLDETR